jgi:hypothetical protein
MDQEIRNKLRNVVTQCRKLLEDAISQELEGKYGIFAKKDQVTADPNAKMPHLSEEEQAARKDVLDHFAHIKARGFKPKESLDQLVREIAFTHLNRLCAYKMMEAREVFVGGQKFREAVSRGVNSNGVKFYLAEHEEDERLFNTGHQDVAYRHFLDWLGGALSDEIGVLFNPNDSANRLHPRQKTLDEVLELLNGGGIKPEETELREAWPNIWSQDETIGWVYQYFTPKELRDQARKESQAPRNSYELAFRNQFFTPRYVVEFLTDNTLGRIWYEMRKGDTKLKDQCRYMVRRPTEVFLNEGESLPVGQAFQPDSQAGKPDLRSGGESDDLSQAELLKLPVHIPHRPKKDPRELKILDPACGSGHFLLYCFDLLLTIYLEAYADPDLGPALQKDYPTLEDLRRDVPRLILAHNLHGIDIDLRASQIAALALWLRCQRAYQEMGLKKDRPKITRSNFVCAEPMPGEEQMLKEFVGQLEPKLLGQLVEVVFEKMKLAGEAGSLLKIEEELRDAVAEARRLWLAGPVSIQRSLFGDDKPALRQQQFDFSGITDAQFFEQAEAKVVEALRKYAEHAQNGLRLQRRLFSDDAVRGFAFVDLCHKRFDVVLMNPPFGDPSHLSRKMLEARYAHLSNEIAIAFVQRSSEFLLPTGFGGILSPRNPLFLDSTAEFRREFFFCRTPLSLVIDAGFGVLDDAMIETAVLVYSAGGLAEHAWVARLLDVSPSDKAQELARHIDHPSSVFVCGLTALQATPNSAFAYWATPRLLRILQESSHLDSIADGKWGLFTADNERFLRLWWETSLSTGWVPYYKGGSFRRFIYDAETVVNWEDEGRAIKGNVDARGRQRSRVPNSEFYFRRGLTFPNVTFKGLAVRAFPEGAIFSLRGPAIFTHDEADNEWLLAFLNSRSAEVFVGMQAATRRWELAQVMRIPIPDMSLPDREELAHLARDSCSLAHEERSWDETSRYFIGIPFISHNSSLLSATESFNRRRKYLWDRASDLLDSIERIAERLYGLDAVDIQCVRRFTGQVKTAESEPEEEEDPDIEPADVTVPALARRVISFGVGCVIRRLPSDSLSRPMTSGGLRDPFAPLPSMPAMRVEADPSSQLLSNCEGLPVLLVDDPDHSDDIVRRVREVLEVIWKDRTEAIEKETCEILGIKELRDYFRKPGKGGFWDDHVSRYSKSRRKAPIYWLLQSSKKNYALWLYYHRLDKDLLFKALVNYVEPKIRLETSRLDSLRSQKAAAGESGTEAKRLAKEVERQEDFLSELRDFEDKLRRAANLHLEPDLNDGVVLNIAPLHELVPWKEAKNYWEELLAGKYEWSSIGKQLREKGLVK